MRPSRFDYLSSLARKSPSKIVLFVIDGLGGLPHPETGKTELETAQTPNLDALAARGACGLTYAVTPGVTPGSGPAHLALFGYDPLEYDSGRGVLEVLGIDFELEPGDVAARGNFCTVDERGVILDRRAGRISTDRCIELCRFLGQIEVDGAEILVLPVAEHRFALVFRGEGLSADLAETDPHREGVIPPPVAALSPQARRTAQIANQFISRARELLAETSTSGSAELTVEASAEASHPANMIITRGFSQLPQLPSMREVFKLNPLAIASYPLYRGVARLVGMTVLAATHSLEEGMEQLHRHYNDHDFFFLHIKQPDARGEDGDFPGKVAALEQIDSQLGPLIELSPEVLIVAGDHSTPALLRSHSWHPVPFVLVSPWGRVDGVKAFSETACAQGCLGTFPALDVMPLALAHALKLSKFGA